MNLDLAKLSQQLLAIAVAFGIKIIGAIALWFIGRMLIKFAARLVNRALARKTVEPTVANYLSSTVSVLLNISLVVALLGYFGVQTTTFAALLAAAGFAIGTAWSGLLANFAAGVFLLFLRPFKVGDMISAGGVTGVVEEIGMFATTLNTADNIRTFVGNNKIFSDNIQNFSANPFRRVDLVAQISGAVDHNHAIELLKEALKRVPNVVAAPAPVVEILNFTEFGPVLAVRPFCHNDHYWQVFFDTNKLIKETFGEAGFPAPTRQMTVQNK